LKAIYYILVARLKEFYRDRASLMWNFAFPIFILAGFYFVFTGDPEPVYKVGVVKDSFQQEFKQLKNIKFIDYDSQAVAVEKLRRHKIDLVLFEDQQKVTYWVNTQAPKTYFVELLLKSHVKKPVVKAEVAGKEISYIQWVFPGIIGMNLMFSCLWGVGYVIVKYRQDGYLKRLNATPLSSLQFLTGQLLARIVISIGVSAILFLGGLYVLGIPMQGSYFNLMLVFLSGVASLVAVGLIVATRTTSKEFADGILNVVSWPMMFFSEVWFSLEDASQWVQNIASFIPLTHLIKGSRSIITEGKGLADVLPHIIYMLGFTVVFVLISAFLFKWSED
jgi:ABC-2 type transport system permease protein